MSCIYILEDKLNKKCYVGQTTRKFIYRLKQHINGKQYIDKALRKRRLENFNKYIYYVPNNLLDYFEIKLIKILNSIDNGYNLDSGGNKNKKHCYKTKQKMSKLHKGVSNHFYGKKHSNETKLKISKSHANVSKINNPFYGRHHTKEVKQYLSDLNNGEKHPFYNKKHSKKTRQKLSNIMTGRYDGKNHPQSKKIICIDTGEIFECIKEASIKYNIDQSSISKCCKKIRKFAGNKRWEYLI